MMRRGWTSYEEKAGIRFRCLTTYTCCGSNAYVSLVGLQNKVTDSAF